MTAPPPWRRLSPDSPAARLAAASAALLGAAALAILVAWPLVKHVEDARERAERLDGRAASLLAAAADRRTEAGLESADAESLATAASWLSANAPAQDQDTAVLELLSSIRLLAEAAGVTLESAAPLDAEAAGAGLLKGADMAGLRIATAEARITADHAGLARFLAAVEAARPTLRAAAIEITARSAAALEEESRLTASVVIGALSHPRGG